MAAVHLLGIASCLGGFMPSSLSYRGCSSTDTVSSLVHSDRVCVYSYFYGAAGQEAGWRGFALKKMLGYSSPLKAAVLLGIVWSFWHLPLFFINGTTQNTLTSFGSIPAILGYTLYTVMISVLITLTFIMSNGSVFGSMLLHTVGNLSLGVVPLIFSKHGAVTLLLILCITVTAVIYKYKRIMFQSTI